MGWYIFIGVAGLMLGGIIGAVTIGLLAGGKCQELQNQLDTKREVWCVDCNTRELLSGARETLKRVNKSNAALGGVINAQVYEIKRLKLCLRRAKIDIGETYFNSVARG